MAVDDNTLVRSVPCEVCGSQVLWTQAAWPEEPGARAADTTRAAYRCLNGHLIDPIDTPQCPNCGVHDTFRTDADISFACRRCETRFTVPR
jgi:hypothetical protein